MIDFDGQVFENLKYMGMSIPDHTQQTLNHYLLYGFEPGGFVSAMLAQDYESALYRADTGNRQMFWAIAMWIREFAPEESQGSYAAVEAYCKDKEAQERFRLFCEKKYMWKTLERS